MSATAAKTRAAKPPTRDEYLEAEDILSNGVSEVDHLEIRFHDWMKPYPEFGSAAVQPAPTFDAIGQLAAFIDTVDTYADSLQRSVEELRKVMGDLIAAKAEIDFAQARQ